MEELLLVDGHRKWFPETDLLLVKVPWRRSGGQLLKQQQGVRGQITTQKKVSTDEENFIFVLRNCHPEPADVNIQQRPSISKKITTP